MSEKQREEAQTRPMRNPAVRSAGNRSLARLAHRLEKALHESDHYLKHHPEGCQCPWCQSMTREAWHHGPGPDSIRDEVQFVHDTLDRLRDFIAQYVCGSPEVAA